MLQIIFIAEQNLKFNLRYTPYTGICGKENRMDIKDYVDLETFQQIQDLFSDATGLAAIAVDSNGEYISEPSNFTEFCIDKTRGSVEGLKRCVKCDNECSGTYYCHAGLMDFSEEIIIDGKVVGKIIGGQVLPCEPDLDKFRQTAVELGIDPDEYVEAVKKVPIRNEKSIRAAAKLMGVFANTLVNNTYLSSKNQAYVDNIRDKVDEVGEYVKQINKKTGELTKIENSQKMLALNAAIEAARVGEQGKGFGVVAKKVEELAASSGSVNKSISEIMNGLTTAMESLKEND